MDPDPTHPVSAAAGLRPGPLTLTCSCGKKLLIKPELLGKKIQCPGCRKVLAVPMPAPADEPAGGGEPAVRELTDFLAPPQAPDEIGRLGGYRVLKILGHGGMGVVFQAEDPRLQRLVALKVMLPAQAGAPSARERFFREGRAAAALKHSNIVTIFQVGEERGAPFLAMEYLEAVTGLNPSYFSKTGKGRDKVANFSADELKRFPVDSVSWIDAQEFIKLRNQKVQDPGWVYRLPTEAEWEFACRTRPGANTFDYAFDFYFEQPANELLPDQANFDGGQQRTCPVGSYKPNRLGLFDMHGNVEEWCEDEVKLERVGVYRVVRGGGFFSSSRESRAAIREIHLPSERREYRGLRLARVPAGEQGK